MRHRSIRQRSEHPEDDFHCGKWVGRQVERQRRQCTGETGHRDAGQYDRKRTSIAPRQKLDEKHRHKGTCKREERQSQREQKRETAINSNNSAE